MAPSPVDPTDASRDLRARMRSDLTAAIKAREPQVVSALRSALAALDNAEAVTAPEASTAAAAHVAGAESGVGATEATRRDLTWVQIQAVLTSQVDEYNDAAEYYETAGQTESAAELRIRAAALAPYRDNG